MVHSESSASNIIGLMTKDVKDVLEIPLLDLRYMLDIASKKADALKKSIADIREMREKLEKDRLRATPRGLIETAEILKDLSRDRDEARKILREMIAEKEFLERVIEFKTKIIV